jgi:hypothetical protein
MEVGPLRLVPGGNGELKEVEGGWNEYTNMIFSASCQRAFVYSKGLTSLSLCFRSVDQPVGTGYSYMSTNEYVHELPEVRLRRVGSPQVSLRKLTVHLSQTGVATRYRVPRAVLRCLPRVCKTRRKLSLSVSLFLSRSVDHC